MSQTSAAIALSRKAFGAVFANQGLRTIIGIMAGVYLILALFMLILISGLRVFINIEGGMALTFGQQFGILLILLMFYIVNYLASSMSNVAVCGAALIALADDGSGGAAPQQLMRAGFRLAVLRSPVIIGYAALSASLGILARVGLRFSPRGRSENLAVSVIGSLVGTAVATTWDIIPFLIFPVIVTERRGLFNSMRESAQIFSDSMGDHPSAGSSQFIGLVVLVALLAIIPGCLLVSLSMALRSTFLSALGFIGIFMLIGVFTLLAGAANAFASACLYRYIRSDSPGPVFTGDELRAVYSER